MNFARDGTMSCPQCEHQVCRVTDSRSRKGLSVRRRRECLSCRYRFTTLEIHEDEQILVSLQAVVDVVEELREEIKGRFSLARRKG